MNTFIKEVNNLEIFQCNSSNKYYFRDEEENWTFEDESLELVEDVARHYPND